MTNFAEMNADQLRATITAAEDFYESAMAAKNFDVAESWSITMDTAFQYFVTLVEAEDPHTTVADIRYFEGFKYV